MNGTYYPTANEYIALPTINLKGEIESLNYLSMVDRGMIELTGKPFIKPVIQVDGEILSMENLIWTYENYWIPTFRLSDDRVNIIGRYVCPLDTKGWFLRISVESKIECEVTVELKGDFGECLHSINESKTILGERFIYKSLWNRGLVFDFRTGVTKFSFAFLTPGDFDQQSFDETNFTLTKNVNVKAGNREDIDLFMGLGFEEVGSTTQAIHMDRETGDVLIDQLKSWLAKRVKTLSSDHMESILNVNQFFNYFYSSGKTLDTEELILCTSRSPRYYVSAAYWDRDSLIWSFPSLLMTDVDTAREALRYVFGRQRKNIGIHSRYIDGTVLEPGFELDELCAPFIALKSYLDYTDDFDFLSELRIVDFLKSFKKTLMKWKHKEIDLFGTFLMPTDDMRVYPYLTYNNVLVWVALFEYARIARHFDCQTEADWALELRKRVEDAIWKHCVDHETGTFAWSVSLDGKSDFYDEPPGSLTLLPYYEFCSSDNPVYVKTMETLYSSDFAHYFWDSAFKELGCSHADHPWILSIANSLLNGRHIEALDMLSRTQMDNYIACESIDEDTGVWQTGAHFATCAGFLVHSIMKAYEEGHL